MSAPERATGPLQREIRLLCGALIAFLIVLIVALLTLTVSILRLNGRASTADSVTDAIRPGIATASQPSGACMPSGTVRRRSAPAPDGARSE